ncbi:hypothetical protein DITRI_Ditri16bG0063100 [Diplodiscus trichospermus]
MEDWLEANLLGRINDGAAEGWDARFTCSIWWIWKWRNAYIFKEETTLLHGRFLFLRILWVEVDNAFILFKTSIGIRSERQIVMIKWTPPPLHWWKLNCDGAVVQNIGTASCGENLKIEVDSLEVVELLSARKATVTLGGRGTKQRIG